jgi:hypothetical protein
LLFTFDLLPVDEPDAIAVETARIKQFRFPHEDA